METTILLVVYESDTFPDFYNSSLTEHKNRC